MKETLWLLLVLAALLALSVAVHRPLWKHWQPISADPVRLRRWFWGLLIGTVLLFALQGAVSFVWGGLATSAAPHGIVSLELARDPAAARLILDSWRGARTVGAAVGVGIDSLCLVAYAILLHFLCAWTSFALARASPVVARLGRVLASAALFAGGCNAGENVGLLVMLARGPSGPLSPWAEATATLSTAKLTLIAISLVYVLLGLLSQDNAEDFLEMARTVRFSVGLSLLAPLVLVSLDQALDALRVLAESLGERPSAVVYFYAAALFFAFASWYWARVLVYLLEPDAMSSSEEGRRLAATLLPRFCFAAPLVLGAIALWVASRPLAGAADVSTAAKTGLPRPPTPIQLRLWAMALLMLLLAGSGMRLLRARRSWLERRRAQRPAAKALPDARLGLTPALLELDLWTRTAMAVTALPGIAFWLRIGFGGPDGMLAARSVGPVAVLLIGLGLLLPVGNFLVYAHGKTRIPFLTLLAAAAVAFAALDLGDNHAVRLLREGAAPQPPSLLPAFNQWLQARGDRGRYDSYPVVFVAAEGGGIRAAYQAAITLTHLQDMLQDPRQGVPVSFAEHTFLISGVSGGSIGAAVFAGLADRYTAANTARPPPASRDGEVLHWERAADAVLQRDLLSPSLAGMLSPDLVQRFLPITCDHCDGTSYFDRALGLEYALERAWEEGTQQAEPRPSRLSPSDGTGNAMRRSVYAGEGTFCQRDVPALCLNTTRVETGERMIISTLALEPPAAPRGSGSEPDGVRPVCLSELYPRVNLRLSTAACLSSRYPFISSSGYLKVARFLPPLAPAAPPPNGTRPGRSRDDPGAWALMKQRYVDGGYFENSGVSTLADILTILRQHGPMTDCRGAVIHWHPVVVTISFHGKTLVDENAPAPAPSLEAGPGRPAGPGDGPFPNRPRPGSPFDDFLTPLFAFLGTRTGHSLAAERRLNSMLAEREWDAAGALPERISFAFYNYERPLPLGWMLSKMAARELQRQVRVNDCGQCQQVRAALAPCRKR